jgi:histone acetyltransferase (RNA polymerase elongator complex component)
VRLYPFFIPHAGCPHRCRFCQQQRTSGQGKAPAPEEVARTLEDILPESGGGEVAFYGGTFTLLPEEAQQAYLGAAAPFMRNGRVDGIRISTRPDALSQPAVEHLRLSGVRTVEIGCQSFSPDVLRRSGRGHGAREIGEAVDRLRNAGLAVGLQLMPGLPGSSREEALDSLEQALALRPDFLRIYPTVVLRGTALEEDFHAGHYRPLGLEEAVDLCAEMLWRCRHNTLPVIRLGLQGTPELETGQAWVAGPWHPAFGQLVRSRLWRRGLERGGEATGSRRAEVHPADFSDARGHGRFNLEYLRQRFGEFIISSNRLVPREHMAFGGQCFTLTDLSGYEGQNH